MKVRKIPNPENLIPLPDGVRVGEKPDGLDFMIRGNERWIAVIQRLETIDNTATIQVDVAGCSKSKIQGFKQSIKNMANKLNFKYQIRFCVQGNTLHIWTNK